MSDDCRVNSSSLPFGLDLLRLQHNELSEDGVDFKELKILNLAQTFLATLMFSGFSLPEDFEKVVSFHHFERQRSTAARDILLLYIIIIDGNKRANIPVSEVLPTLWFSLRLPTNISTYLKETLNELSAIDFRAFAEKVGGKVSLAESYFNDIQKVWKYWRDLNCAIGSEGCVALEQKRKNKLRGIHLIGVEEYREFLPELQIPSVDQWFADGNFIYPRGGQKGQILSHFNPLHVEPIEVRYLQYQSFRSQNSKCRNEGLFSTRFDWLPFKIFDYNAMKKMFDDVPISAVELIHKFITKMTLRLQTLFDGGHINVNLKPYKDEKPPHGIGNTKFDRIYLPSHVTDNLGISRLLDDHEGLINGDNPFAVLIMESTRWYSPKETDKLPSITVTDDVFFKKFQFTTYLKESHALSLNPKTEEFIAFLRAEYMTYRTSKARSGRPSEDLPKLTDVFERNSKWQLRDFRKLKNRVVPFMFRVYPRTMNNLSGKSRFLEWRYVKDG